MVFMGNLNIDGLIEMASKRLGVPPEKLRSSLSDGNLSEIAGNLSENDREKIKSVMNNPELAKRFNKQFMGK